MAFACEFVTTLFSQDPNRTTVALTMLIQAQDQGHSTALVLMVEAVNFALPHSMDHIDIGTPFEPANTLLETYQKAGGLVFVCEACAVHSELDLDQIRPDFQLIRAADMIPLLMNARGGLSID